MDKKGIYTEAASAVMSADVALAKMSGIEEEANAGGTYHAVCRRPHPECLDEYAELLKQAAFFAANDQTDKANELLAKADTLTFIAWEDDVKNVVTTVGKNYALDLILAASAYTVIGPYMGLINTNASAAAVGDTMASHAGWLEVGVTNDPHYTVPRKTITFSSAAAGSKASTGTYTFAITSAGTVGGCFLVLHTGALSTIDNAAGTLYSAGAFTGGSKVVANLDSLTVTYTASM